MDSFDEEILKFWKALQDRKVQYIMVGDYATNLHGYQHFTVNLDMWLKDSLESRQHLRDAFIDCDMGDYPMLEYMQLPVATFSKRQCGRGQVVRS